MENFLFIPSGNLASDDDAAARKRKEIAEKLKRGQDVNITNTGEVVPVNDPKASDSTLVVPAGKLAASFYWYERDPTLLKQESTVMQIYFPQFTMDKLEDGRLFWYGNLNPRGASGGVWTIQAIYDHNHPHNNSYGGSVRVYSIKPALEDLVREVGSNLPHLLKDDGGNLFMCTARMEDVDAGGKFVTSAAKSIGWAAKWIWIVEGWLNGELKKEEVFGHTF